MDRRGLHPRFVAIVVFRFRRCLERGLLDALIHDLLCLVGFRRCEVLDGQPARQDHMGHFRHDDSAAGISESSDQAELTLHAPDLVPGQPKAVRGSQARLALVLGQVLRGKKELLLRCRVTGIVILVVEGIDGQLPINQDGLLVIVRVK